MIFHDATLKEMAASFPINKEEFLNISGVGLKKFENYGEDFIAVIANYCDEKEIAIEASKKKNIIHVEVEEAPNTENLDRYELTYRYYEEGLCIDEMAQKRDMGKKTIIKHLQKCEAKGLIVDWDRFIDDALKEEKILRAIEQVGLEKLKPIKELLPEDISYDDIHIVIFKNKLEEI